MAKIFKLAAAAALTMSGLGLSTTANASGFLTDVFVRPFSPELADNIDDAHRNMGAPLNGVWVGAATAGAEWVAPGSGAFVGGMVARNNRVGFPQGPQGPGFNQQPMGNFCYTQAGRFGPGPVNPLGAPCSANTPWGMMPGQVGQ